MTAKTEIGVVQPRTRKGACGTREGASSPPESPERTTAADTLILARETRLELLASRTEREEMSVVVSLQVCGINSWLEGVP